jgi:hypothetical protein
MDRYLFNWQSPRSGRCGYRELQSDEWIAAADDIYDEFGVEGIDQFLWSHFGELLGPSDRKDVRDAFLERRCERQSQFLESLGLMCVSASADEYRPCGWSLTSKGFIAGILSPSGWPKKVMVRGHAFWEAALVWQAISERLELGPYEKPSSLHWERVWSGHVYQGRWVVGVRDALVAGARRREGRNHATN